MKINNNTLQGAFMAELLQNFQVSKMEYIGNFEDEKYHLSCSNVKFEIRFTKTKVFKLEIDYHVNIVKSKFMFTNINAIDSNTFNRLIELIEKHQPKKF